MNDAPMIPAPAADALSAYPIGIPWPFNSHLRLPAVSEAVPVARQHARAKLAQWHMADTWPVEIVVSELMTNAVRASAGLMPGMIRLWLCSDRCAVLVQVWDACEALPAREDADPLDDHGRGLLIVDAFSKHWGVYRPAAANGKVTWALVREVS